MFYNPASKKAVVAHRGTAMRAPKRIWSYLKSDFNIMLGQVKVHMQIILDKMYRTVLQVQ